jgi:hypothetical protein
MDVDSSLTYVVFIHFKNGEKGFLVLYWVSASASEIGLIMFGFARFISFYVHDEIW